MCNGGLHSSNKQAVCMCVHTLLVYNSGVVYVGAQTPLGPYLSQATMVICG